jgi:hypothetical protein
MTLEQSEAQAKLMRGDRESVAFKGAKMGPTTKAVKNAYLGDLIL